LQSGGEHKVDGGIKALQIVSSYYALEKREQTLFQVLKKVDLDVHGRVLADGSQRLSVQLGRIHLKVAPSIIRLLSAVSAGFSATASNVRIRIDETFRLSCRLFRTRRSVRFDRF